MFDNMTNYYRLYYNINTVELSKYILTRKSMNNLYLQAILIEIYRNFLKDGIEIFNDKFVKYTFGYCIPKIYCKYCGFGGMNIHIPKEYRVYNLDMTNYNINIINDIIDSISNMKFCQLNLKNIY